MRSSTLVLTALLCACSAAPEAGSCPELEQEPLDSPTTQQVDALGGLILHGDDVTLDLPPGAVSQPTPVTITRFAASAEAGTLGPIYEFGPSGTQFAQPVQVTLSYAGLDLASATPVDLRVATYEDGAWQPIAAPTIDEDAKTVSGSTTHFSAYAIILIPRLSSGDPRCPRLPPTHSSTCVDRGRTCAWQDADGSETEAFCNGTFWIVAHRIDGCPATRPAGGCGQFPATCGYLEDATYPQEVTNQLSSCLVNCDCQGGRWACEDSCTCPGKPTDDPARAAAIIATREGDFFAYGCLHDAMSCRYTYVAGQACVSTFTCEDGGWSLDLNCACPTERPSQGGVCRDASSCNYSWTFVGSSDSELGDGTKTFHCTAACSCSSDRWSCSQSCK